MPLSRLEFLHVLFARRWSALFPNTEGDPFFNAAILADPTNLTDETGNLKKVGGYAEWILRCLFRESDIQTWIRFQKEDADKTRDELALFHRKKHLLPQEKRDIGRYRSLTELGQLVMNDLSLLETQQEAEDRFKKDTLYLGETEDFRVIVPLTKEASCFWGRGTRWCTAATRSTNYFEHYNQHAPLYVILQKDSGNGKPWKFQIHFGTQQYADASDCTWKLSKIFELAPEARGFIADHLAKLQKWNETPKKQFFAWLITCDPCHPQIAKKFRKFRGINLRAAIQHLSPQSVGGLIRKGALTSQRANRALNYSVIRFRKDGRFAVQLDEWSDAIDLIDIHWRETAKEYFGNFRSFIPEPSPCAATDAWRIMDASNRKHVLRVLRDEYPGKKINEANAAEFLSSHKGLMDSFSNAAGEAESDAITMAFIKEFEAAIRDHLGPARVQPQLHGSKRVTVLRFEDQDKLESVFDATLAEALANGEDSFPWGVLIHTYVSWVYGHGKFSHIRDKSENTYPDYNAYNHSFEFFLQEEFPLKRSTSRQRDLAA